jgi:hypothetical protein
MNDAPKIYIRKTWSQLVVGDFGGNGWTDLLFYERPG